jgi:selenocysteine lyase/cysteine desulfurase
MDHAGDLARYRSEFPVVQQRTYLISASLGPLSSRARAAAEEHLDLWQRLGPEELWFDHGLPKLQECRELFARLIGADADEVGIVPSVSSAMSSVATCLDYGSRPQVVLTDMDFPTNHYVWRAQQQAGAKPDVVSSDDGIRVHPERYVERIGDQTALVNVNRVLYSSSWIVDLVPIVAAAHEAGALVLVDDYHGSGVLPIDVHALDVDILVSGALKWICGGQGIAFLYCRRDLIPTLDPRVVGWFGAKDFFSFDASDLRLRDDARRFETGTFALPQAWTAAAAMSVILEVGVDAIRARNQELTGAIVEHARRRGLEVLSPTVDGERGGLVRVRMPGGTAGAAGLLKELFERDVVLDRRGDAFRISPHFFNNEDDLERCFRVLAELL